MTQPTEVNYEKMPATFNMDETDINVRAYFSRMSDDRLKEYKPEWTDEQLKAWDGNFRSDGALMLVCCERDVEADDYRQIIEVHIKLRGLTTDG